MHINPGKGGWLSVSSWLRIKMAFLSEYSLLVFMNVSEKLQSPERRTSKNVSLSFNLFRMSCQTQFPSFPALLPPSAAGNLGISPEVWASQLVMACFLAHRSREVTAAAQLCLTSSKRERKMAETGEGGKVPPTPAASYLPRIRTATVQYFPILPLSLLLF